MAKYTLDVSNCTPNMLRDLYFKAKEKNQIKSESDLDYIFETALKNPDRFPGININDKHTPENYIEHWVKNYLEADNNPPSKRAASPKSSCNDPAIGEIIISTGKLTTDEYLTGLNNHNLFMSAENILGNLLEEYIAQKARPYGFIWCKGNVLRAIDFCTTSGSVLLQIKNKNNTENSSSSNIREGTSIKKWYRLKTKKLNGFPFPSFNWDDLNLIINSNKTIGFNLDPCKLTEDDYQAFLTRISVANHDLITDK